MIYLTMLNFIIIFEGENIMKIQNVKGGYDFLPNEQKIQRYYYKITR